MKATLPDPAVAFLIALVTVTFLAGVLALVLP